MNKRKDNSKISLILLIVLNFLFIFMVISSCILYLQIYEDNHKISIINSIIYTSCFGEDNEENLIAYEVPSYDIKEELNKTLLKTIESAKISDVDFVEMVSRLKDGK